MKTWRNEAARILLDQVARLTRQTPIICAGASHGPLVALGVQQLGIEHTRIFGSAPHALVSGLRALVALEACVSPCEVAINLLGVPPTRPVIAWSSATIGGYPIEDTLSPPQLVHLRDRVTRSWPPGPFVLASAAARVVEAVVNGGTRRTFTLLCRSGLRRGTGRQIPRRQTGPGWDRGDSTGNTQSSRAGTTGQCARRELTRLATSGRSSASPVHRRSRPASPGESAGHDADATSRFDA